MEEKKVIIYSTPTCHFCHLAKDFFTKNGIEYTDYDVFTNMDKRTELLEKTGQLSVPVIMINDEIIVGFNEEKIQELLEI